MRGPISLSRTHPRVGELPLASTCAITSRPVAGDRDLQCGRNSLLLLALSHGAPFWNWHRFPPSSQLSRFNPVLNPKTRNTR
jgi:hypothetical protein